MCRKWFVPFIAVCLLIIALPVLAEEPPAETQEKENASVAAERMERAKPAAPARCGKCGDGACVPQCGETAQSCPRDCGVPAESLIEQCGEAKPKAEAKKE